MVVAVSQCSRCGSQTFEDDAYCQECGKFQGSETTDTSAPKATADLVAPHTSEFLTNLNPRSAKPVVSLPVVAGVIALLLLIPCGIYAIEHSYESISKSYICDQARKAIEAGTPAAAIELLNRLELTQHGLSSDQRNLLDRALSMESEQMVVAGNYQRAKSDLQQIKGALAQNEEVHQRLQICDRYLAQQAAGAVKAPQNADSHAGRRMSKLSTLNIVERARRSLATTSSARAVAPAVKIAAKVSPTIAAPTAATTSAKASSTIAATTTTVSPTTSASTTASPEVSPPDTNVSPAASAATTSDSAQISVGKPSTDKPKKGKTAAAGFSHNDVARYNALLAGYFSSRGGNDGELREPLSFREWVEKGKPKF
jgi:hypothetical protein